MDEERCREGGDFPGKQFPSSLLLEKNYADVLKAVQASINPDDYGVSVKAIRQTKTGDVLIELKATKEYREGFGTALAGALGDNGGVRHLVSKGKLVIYKLVETTEVIDVEEALKATLGEQIGAPPRIYMTRRVDILPGESAQCRNPVLPLSQSRTHCPGIYRRRPQWELSQVLSGGPQGGAVSEQGDSASASYVKKKSLRFLLSEVRREAKKG